jgi:hypothetical protein
VSWALPEESAQYQSVRSRVVEFGEKAREAESRRSALWGRIAAGAGPGTLVAWKLKLVLLIALTKGRFLEVRLNGLFGVQSALFMW